MEQVKNELQDIIFGDGTPGKQTSLKKIQLYLRGYAKTIFNVEKQLQVQNKETTDFLNFIGQEALWYNTPILEQTFISEGAEQKVYRLNNKEVIKTNWGVFTNIGLTI